MRHRTTRNQKWCSIRKLSLDTILETNITPRKSPSQKEFHLPTMISKGYVGFKEGTCICLATLDHVISWMHQHTHLETASLVKLRCQWYPFEGNIPKQLQYSCQIYLWVNSQTSPTPKFDGKNNWILSLRLYPKSNVYLKGPVDKPRSGSSIWGIYQFWKTTQEYTPRKF